MASREAALHESEGKFRAFVEGSTEGLVLTDEQGVVVEWNRALELITGLEKNNALSKYVWDVQTLILVPERRTPEVEEGIKKTLQDVLRTGSFPMAAKVIESEICQVSGKRITIEQLNFTIKSEKGYWIGSILRDISSRRQAENVSEVLYRISEAAHTAPNLDELYRIIHASISGLMPAKNLYIAYYDASTDLLHFPYHVDERDLEWPPMKPGKGLTRYVYTTGKPLLATPEIFQQLLDSSEVELIGQKPVDWLGVPLRTQHGIIGVMAVQTYHLNERLGEEDRDILVFISTQVAMVLERRQVEEALRASQANLAEAQRIAHIGSWDWNILTNDESWSDELFRITGWEPKRAHTLDAFLQLVHPEDRQRVKEVIENSQKQYQPYSLDHRIVRSDGKELILHRQAEVFLDDNGKPVRMLGTVQDITDIRRAEAERDQLIKELQAKNTELDRFTYTVSHDLRAPLVTIRGFMGFLLKDIQTGNIDQLSADMERITTAIKKMHQFLDELLELSRAGHMITLPEPISFHTIVADAIEMNRGRIDARAVQVSIADDLPVILCDRIRFTQVVQNLVDNAIKFIGDQPKPRVEIGMQGINPEGQAIFYVLDNGIGIDPQYQEKIFGLFDKLDNQSDGMGIGLTLVKRIVEAHSGKVWLKSDGAGTGSTFFFTCPTAAGPLY